MNDRPVDIELARTILEQPRQPGITTLDEHASLCVLDAFGIPTVRRVLLTDPADHDALDSAAETIGYPVVLKGVVAGCIHKTEKGLVHAGLGDGSALRRAASAMIESGPQALLVQKHVRSAREIAAGSVVDESFGPSVMVGFGGVHAEVVADTATRIAPLTRADALEAIDSLRSRPMLDEYRGGATVDIEALCAILVTLGHMAVQLPAISAMDLNPIVFDDDGAPVVVDAAIVMAGRLDTDGDTHQPV